MKEGAFTSQAKRAHKTPTEFASKVTSNPEDFSSTTEKRAQLVKTFAKMSRGK